GTDVAPIVRFLSDIIRRTSDQLVHSRKLKLEDRRVVRLSVAEDQIDSWHISLQRAAGYRRREKVLCVSRSPSAQNAVVRCKCISTKPRDETVTTGSCGRAITPQA